MYAEGNDGSKGDNCTLSSISITPQSSQSVEFFFHIYDNEFWVDIGGLEVVTLKVSSGEETRLWFHNVSTGNVWTRECVNLPQGHEIKVIFRAFRTTKASMYDADIALDDVTLQNQLCEGNTCYLVCFFGVQYLMFYVYLSFVLCMYSVFCFIFCVLILKI